MANTCFHACAWLHHDTLYYACKTHIWKSISSLFCGLFFSLFFVVVGSFFCVCFNVIQSLGRDNVLTFSSRLVDRYSTSPYQDPDPQIRIRIQIEQVGKRWGYSSRPFQYPYFQMQIAYGHLARSVI